MFIKKISSFEMDNYCCYLFGLLLLSTLCQSIDNIADDDKATAVTLFDNKYRLLDPVALEQRLFGIEARDLPEINCHLDVSLRWTATVGSSAYSTPLVADMNGNGERDVFVATLNHYVERLHGRNGKKVKNWPFAFASRALSASPLLYDVTGDGVEEIVVTTDDAEMVFIDAESGTPVYGGTLKVPPLRVKRDWFEGLDSPLVEATMSLHGQASSTFSKKSKASKNAGGKPTVFSSGRQLHEASQSENAFSNGRSSKQVEIALSSHEMPASLRESNESENTFTSGRRLHSNDDDEGEHRFGDEARESGLNDFKGWLTDDGLESLELFLPTKTPRRYVEQVREQRDPLRSTQYERWSAAFGKRAEGGSKYVWVDAHVMATPVIADLDGDGIDELVVPVSYFYATERYTDPVELAKLGANVDISRYVACGVAAFEIARQAGEGASAGRVSRLKWLTNLDLTTDSTAYRAYMSASPALADLDGDGSLEIVVATGVGWLYVLDAQGKLWTGAGDAFPMLLDALFAAPSIEDVDGDGALDIVAADSNGNVVAVRAVDGTLLWDASMRGYATRAAALADIDGNGSLDVVLASNAGQLWAFDGATGKQLEHFPVKLGRGRARSQPLVVATHFVAVHASDGILYLVDGRSGCAERVDIGSSSDATVVADDIDGDGRLDLLVTTVGRQLMLLQTDVAYHPLHAYTGDAQSLRSAATARYGRHGIYALPAADGRYDRTVSGASFVLPFEIVDARPRAARKRSRYRVRVRNANRQLLYEAIVEHAGLYSADIPSPNGAGARSLLIVEMENEHRQRFEHRIWITFNPQFYRLLKYALLVPIAVMIAIVQFVRRPTSSSSSSSSASPIFQ
jgi:FG-GAP-like repeat